MNRSARFSAVMLLAGCAGTSTANTVATSSAGTGPTVTLTSAVSAPDVAPALLTLRGVGTTSVVAPPPSSTVYDVATVGTAVRAIPPGGFVVRGTTGVSRPRVDPVVATARPVEVVGVSPGTHTVAMNTVTDGELASRRDEGESASVGGRTRRRSPMSPTTPARPVAAPHRGAAGRATTAERAGAAADDFVSEGASFTVSHAAPPVDRSIRMPPSPINTVSEVRVTVGITAPVVAQQPVVEESILTAASVGDVDRRDNYLEYLSRHPSEREELGLDLSRRVRLRVVDANGHPVNAAQITLSGMGVNVAALSHADGYWDFYPGVSAPSQLSQGGTLTARAEVQGISIQSSVVVSASGDGAPVMLQLPAIIAPPAQPTLDLGFAIDVTGSMGDELEYVHHEVDTIVQKIQAQNPGTRVRVGATFYRDRVDPVVLQQIPFTSDVMGFASAMLGVRASGGGDYPEDMNAGLEAAVNKMAWSDGAAVRVLVLIADAPPQHYPDAQYTYTQAMLEAAQRGIRILPVGASGADRTVEYLFRALGAFTSTPYVYLTDDSGVGSSHMEADTDRVGVEKFADLLVRMVSADLHGDGMHEPGPLGPN